MSAIRCVLLVGTAPGFESAKGPLTDLLVTQKVHHSIGLAFETDDPDDDKALARALRELADALEAPSVPDPDLI